MHKLKYKFEVVIILLVLIAIALAYAFLSVVNDYTLENDSVYFINGVSYEIPSKTVIEINDDGSILIDYDNFDLETTSLPIYEVNNSAIILTTEMAYYKPSNNASFNISKIPQLSRIEIDQNDSLINITKNSNKSCESKGFIFDGHNTYVFLEKIIITYDDKSILLSPLSYAIVEYDNWVQLYDYDSQEYTYYETNSDIVAVCSNNNYSINLGTDVINYYDNRISMLSGFMILKDYFEDIEE